MKKNYITWSNLLSNFTNFQVFKRINDTDRWYKSSQKKKKKEPSYFLQKISFFFFIIQITYTVMSI